MFYEQTLYLTADRLTVVPEGDPRSAFLLVRGGKEVKDGDMRSYGGANGESILAQAKELAKAPAEDKSIEPTKEAEPTPIRRGRGRPQPETKEAEPTPPAATNSLSDEDVAARREYFAKLGDEQLAELIPEGFDGDREALLDALASDPGVEVED